MLNTDTHDIYAAGFDVAQNMINQIKSNLPSELLEHFDLSKAVAFTYSRALDEIVKDNPLDVALRVQFLNLIVSNTSSALKKQFLYDHSRSRWVFTKDKMALKSKSEELNSENLVNHMWDTMVIPSYEMILNTTDTVLSAPKEPTQSHTTRSP